MYLPLRARVSVAVAVLSVLYLLPSIVLWAYSLCLCRRKRDPTRWAFTWLKVAYPFWIAFLTFHILSLSLTTTLYYGPEYNGNSSGELRLAAFAMSSFAWTAEEIANIVVFIVLVHLGLGVLLARANKQVRLHNIISYIALAIFIALLVLKVAYFGILMDNIRKTVVSGFMTSSSQSPDIFLHGHRLVGFLGIFEFILSIMVFAFAIFVFAKVARKYDQLKTAGVFLLVCAIQWCIRNLYELVYFNYVFHFSSVFAVRRPSQYISLLRFFFSITPTFIIVVMLFALGKKKVNGLWSMAPT